MPRQRPELGDRWSELDADPIRQPIPERGPERAGQPDRPEVEVAGADQHADPDQRRPGRHQQRDEGKRLAESEREHDRRRPGLMLAHEFNDLIGVGFDAFEHCGMRLSQGSGVSNQ